MVLPKGPFSGSRLNYRAPCTSSEGRLCGIFKELPLWNEFFWPVGFQLRELSPGQLSLAELHDLSCDVDVKPSIRAATTLIHLLTYHRCVVSVDLCDWIFFAHPSEDKQKLIWDAFRNSPSLRKLKLRLGPSTTTLSQSLAETLPHLIQLRDLDLGYVPFDRRSLEAFSEFLESTRSLTTLTMAELFVSCEEAVLIIQGLKRNVTVTTLSVNTSMLNSDSAQRGIMVYEYLRWNKTLQALSVTGGGSGFVSIVDLRPIMGALFYNDTLSELKLTRLVLDELITDMLILNKTLRSFHMIECISFYSGKYDPHVDPRLVALTNGSSMISRWLVALAENKTLQELALCLDWIDPGDCGSFFNALARNTSLKVTVRNFRDKHVTQICRALRETGVQGRFFVGKHHVLKGTVVKLPECKELSHISVSNHDDDDIEPLRTALRLLPACTHVKSLCLRITDECFNSEVSSLIAEYITNTAALRELDLEFIYGNLNAVDRAELTLLQALSLNTSIRRLSISGLRLNDTEIQVLVDMLHSSRTLCHLSLHTYDDELIISLTQKLSNNLSSNYTLLGMHLSWLPECSDELFIIEEFVRRNSSLVTRAAHFAMGTRHKYCAAAAEHVHFNPGLVEKVRELASIDEDEAASRIKNSLKSITELHDFMCLAGVVKQCVSCHRREDGQKQLVDLNSYCWLHLRGYLKVGDIVDGK